MIVEDEQLARRVGLYALAALVLVIAFFVFVFGRIEWGAHTRVRVYFHQVAALHEGAPFIVAGRTVGTVESIALAPEGSASPLGSGADAEGVVVTVAIDAREARRLDPAGDIFIASKGTLSDRYLELGPAPDGRAGTPGLHEGQQLLGRDPPSLDRVLQHTLSNLDQLDAFAADVKPELDALRAQIDALRSQLDASSPTALPAVAKLAPLIVEVGGLADSIRALRTEGLGGDVGLAHLGEVLARAQSVVGLARASLAELDTGATALRASLASLRAKVGAKGQGAIDTAELALDRVRADLAKLDPLLATVADLQQQLARGDGSLMKLVNDPEFPEDTKELGKILKRHPWRLMERPAGDRPAGN